uniref:matrix-remodeling-associated protein 7 isoform X3 n=1 Tax=Monopterus albus TaxID=43700 RepID=UPI0009B3E0C7|nr:matrix-remodeling-associated protein 7-like isoform X3 [Monopterus albus]
MDLTFILSAIIFTLLAIVVATSLFSGSSSTGHFTNARSYFGHTEDRAAGRLDESGPKQNGHVPGKNNKTEDDWCNISGSSHDHWDVVKSVFPEEAHPNPLTEELATPVEHSSSTSSSPIPRPGSRHLSLETEGATESPGINDEVESSANDSLKYIPGKARSHHLQMMMSKNELEEEQRVQREQLAAIFQLLKDNKETFGEVSDGDIEEQLRLYSI